MPSDGTHALDAAAALLQARICAEQAEQAPDVSRREMLLRLSTSWIEIANKLQALEAAGSDHADASEH
jgi:hypothetical protein